MTDVGHASTRGGEPHFQGYDGRAAEVDAAVVDALWSLRGSLLGLMELGLTKSAAHHVFRHAVLDLWDLRRLGKRSPRRMWSRAAWAQRRQPGLVLDHAIPAKRLSDIALGLGPDASHRAMPESPAQLAALLARMSVCCVITREEHHRLETLDAGSTGIPAGEADPYARYAGADIEVFVPADEQLA